jgi:hypothetical protein
MLTQALTLALSRFAVEEAPETVRSDSVPSTAQRESDRVRVCDSVVVERTRHL